MRRVACRHGHLALGRICRNALSQDACGSDDAPFVPEPPPPEPPARGDQRGSSRSCSRRPSRGTAWTATPTGSGSTSCATDGMQRQSNEPGQVRRGPLRHHCPVIGRRVKAYAWTLHPPYMPCRSEPGEQLGVATEQSRTKAGPTLCGAGSPLISGRSHTGARRSGRRRARP